MGAIPVFSMPFVLSWIDFTLGGKRSAVTMPPKNFLKFMLHFPFCLRL